MTADPGFARPVRVYVDTSVFGGCFDDEFALYSNRFFDEVRAGRFVVVVSELTQVELDGAPAEVRDVLGNLSATSVERVLWTDAVLVLRDAYLAAGIVGERQANDAAHVAAASVANCDLLLSWNFKHLVHFEKAKGYNSVNVLHGYRLLDIRAPREVIHGIDEEEP